MRWLFIDTPSIRFDLRYKQPVYSYMGGKPNKSRVPHLGQPSIIPAMQQ